MAIDFQTYEDLSEQPVPPGGVYWIDVSGALQKLTWILATCAKYEVSPVMAVKAVPYRPLLRAALAQNMAMDVTNLAELLSVEEQANSACSFFLNGPAITPIPPTIAASRVIPIFHTCQQIHAFARTWPREEPVGLRLASSEIIGSAGTVSDSRFGFRLEQLDEARELLARLGMTMNFLHCHHTKDKLTVDDYLRLLSGMSNCARGRLGGAHIQLILGGGQDSIMRKGKNSFEVLLSKLKSCNREKHQLYIEPGALWLSQSIYFVSRLVAVDSSKRPTQMIIDASPSCALEWSETRLSAVLPPGSQVGDEARLLGSTCCEYDFIPRIRVKWPYAEAKHPRVPRNLVIEGVSPYSIARSRAFNGLNRPLCYSIGESYA